MGKFSRAILVLAIALDDAVGDPLMQSYRPPLQTSEQSQTMANITEFAKQHSAAARAWVLDYMGSDRVRSHLHASLQSLSNEDLLERFTWEFERLPIIHNAPTTSLDASEDVIHDDSPLNASWSSGFLQNPCLRQVVGGPEFMGLIYAGYFIKMGMSPSVYANERWPLRQTNQCMLFNANNLKKTSLGNAYYGGLAYVLNPKTLQGRLLVEPWDGGNIEMYRKKVSAPFPGYGTLKDWYHMLQWHEEVFNLPYPQGVAPGTTCCNYSIADLFNRWWVPGVPPPVSGMLAMTPYFEIMVAGNAWLPEDLLYSIARHSDTNESGPMSANLTNISRHHVGLWGTTLGSLLRGFHKKAGRPLIWSDDDDSEMLIDPTVGAIAGGRITSADAAMWEAAWQDTVANKTVEEQKKQFLRLASMVPAHLKLSYRTWATKDVCAEEERDPEKMVMGTDGDGNCVYWVWSGPATKWELMNDGTCLQSDSARALYATEADCRQAAKNTKWGCVTLVPPVSQSGYTASYCVPSASGNFSSVDECESKCFPPKEKRGHCCWALSSNTCALASSQSCPLQKQTQPCQTESACVRGCGGVWCPETLIV